MTLILGIEDRGTVAMGADSGIWDDFAHTMFSPKVLRRGGLLLGVAGDLKPRNVIEHLFSPPARAEDQAAEAYLVREFVPALAAVLGEAGCWKARTNEDQHEGCGSLAMLVGLSGQLFDLGSDLAVSRVRRAFTAVGQSAGVGVALGHMAATAPLPWSATHRIEAALAAASEFSDRVRGPWHIELLAAG